MNENRPGGLGSDVFGPWSVLLPGMSFFHYCQSGGMRFRLAGNQGILVCLWLLCWFFCLCAGNLWYGQVCPVCLLPDRDSIYGAFCHGRFWIGTAIRQDFCQHRPCRWCFGRDDCTRTVWKFLAVLLWVRLFSGDNRSGILPVMIRRRLLAERAFLLVCWW